MNNRTNQFSQYKSKYGNYFGKKFALRFQPSTVTVQWQGNSVYQTWNPDNYSQYQDCDLLFTGLFNVRSNVTIDMVNRLILLPEIYSLVESQFLLNSLSKI